MAAPHHCGSPAPGLCYAEYEHDPIPGSAFIVVEAASEFRDKTTGPNQMWQTDFTQLKVIGWAGIV